MATTLTITDKYKLLRDSYEGLGGYEDGTYLLQHKRETQANFDIRKTAAYYLNYVQPIISSHVDPIFRKDASRKANHQYFEQFVNDCDMHGTTLSEFMQNSSFLAKLMGVSLIVIDNAAQGSQAATVAEAKEKRQFPYCYTIAADSIHKYSIDKFGALNYIIYKEPAIDPKAAEITADTLTAEIKKTQSQLTQNIQYHVWTRNEWAIVDKDGVKIDSGAHNLGIVPVVPLYGRRPVAGQFMVQSEFYNIARVNLRLFNLCSELDEILRGQAFSILIYPGKEMKSLIVGVNNALGFDGVESKHAPSFIAPPSDPADLLMSQADRLIEEMYRMAMLSHSMGAQNSEARTGAAKKWDFEPTNKVLAQFAKRNEIAENRIAYIMARWLNASEPFFNSRYSSDFSIRDTVQELEQAKKALELKISEMFDKEIKKKTAMACLKDNPGSDVEAIITEIDSDNPYPNGELVVETTETSSALGGKPEETTGAPENTQK